MTDPPARPAPDPLPPLPEDGIASVLCIVAHPDDMEYGASAAVHAWTRTGVAVDYALMTSGEAGMAQAPEVVGPLREVEQRAACRAVGVRELEFLGHPDGMLEPGLALRRSVARVVRRHRPDVVLTANFEVEAYGGLNQADHRATGLAVVDGLRDAANPWVFRELAEVEGLAAWSVGALLVAGHERPTHAKAVAQEDVDAAVASLHCHAAYLAHVTGHPAPEDFIPELLRAGGEAAGAEHAVALRVHDLGGLGSRDRS
ncbi:PIG-L deacetylase family protein [Brachybacterium hainanense]|uniref:PIG-L deacetylase family protein n=1 Tax=Brachybacterium hainanense TaxID=1541174 RepID=A0ABV6RA86_9MICO